MLTKVEVENYRGFPSYRMESFARVNLFVGRNNSGKTALAEAIHLIAAGGDPTVLSDAASRRGEMIGRDDSGRLYPDFSHLFHGHQHKAESAFSLRGDNGYPCLNVRLLPIPQQNSLFEESELGIENEFYEAPRVYGLKFESGTGSGEGSIFNPHQPSRSANGEMGGHPTLFVPTDSIPPRRLAQMWRQTLLDSNQQEVVDAIRLVMESIREIVVLPSDVSWRNAASFRDWYVTTSQFKKPVPLGSFGDGVRRLMALALALTHVSEGTLFVDEIDTGLHYTVMEDMWNLVVKKCRFECPGFRDDA